MEPLLRTTSPLEGTSVTTDETILLWGLGSKEYIDLDPLRLKQVAIRLAVADVNLNSLKIYGKVHADDATWIPLATEAADYTATPTSFVLFSQVYTSAGVEVDGDAASIEATQYALLILRNTGFVQLKITATTAASTATVTAYLVGFPTVTLDALGEVGSATAALQTSGNAVLADILAKLIAAPATSALQTSGNVLLGTIDSNLNVLTAAPVAKVPVHGSKVVTTAGTAVPLVASETYVRDIIIQAKKVAASNTGAIHLGMSGLDMGVLEVIELAPGDTIHWPIPLGTKLNIALIYVDADTNADGVTFLYVPV